MLLKQLIISTVAVGLTPENLQSKLSLFSDSLNSALENKLEDQINRFKRDLSFNNDNLQYEIDNFAEKTTSCRIQTGEIWRECKRCITSTCANYMNNICHIDNVDETNIGDFKNDKKLNKINLSAFKVLLFTLVFLYPHRLLI